MNSLLIFQSTDFNILLRKQQVLIMNRKIQMTKRCIGEALFECLKEKGINKITISSLCEKADINRSTFYKYYGSQYDVVKEMEQEVIKLINAQLNDQPKETSFVRLLQFLKSNKETIEHLICITNFFLNDSSPLIWKNAIQKQFRLCTKQFPAGKEIHCDQKSKKHILKYTENLNQLYCDIIKNSLDRLHHTGICTQDIIQSTLNL